MTADSAQKIRIYEDLESWNKKLLSAAVTGDNNSVDECVSHGAQINCRDKSGWTPLHMAACRGHAETINLLISKGAVIDSKDNRGWTPLHRAAYWGNTDTVVLLMSTGAVIDITDKFGKTPYDVGNVQSREGIDEYQRRGHENENDHCSIN